MSGERAEPCVAGFCLAACRGNKGRCDGHETPVVYRYPLRSYSRRRPLRRRVPHKLCKHQRRSCHQACERCGRVPVLLAERLHHAPLDRPGEDEELRLDSDRPHRRSRTAEHRGCAGFGRRAVEQPVPVHLPLQRTSADTGRVRRNDHQVDTGRTDHPRKGRSPRGDGRVVIHRRVEEQRQAVSNNDGYADRRL